jgi:hypothetical protein
MRRPIYRDSDHELLGFVISGADRWRALTVFGGILGTFATERDASAHVVRRGLPSLAAHWQYYDTSADQWHTCLIQEAHESTVTIVLGYTSEPGAPTKTLSADDFARGDILTLE